MLLVKLVRKKRKKENSAENICSNMKTTGRKQKNQTIIYRHPAILKGKKDHIDNIVGL